MREETDPAGLINGDFRCGYVAIVGRPNVGKSTLMNRILGQKLSIVTAKPQTTRQRISGIKTTEKGQIVYIDTPGIHLAASRALNRYMNRIARATVEEVRAHTRELVQRCAAGGGWALGTGNSVANYIPTENFMAMLDEFEKLR